MSGDSPIIDPIQAVLDRLEGVKAGTKGQWLAHCPAHEDRVQSLSISLGNDGRVLLHCHAGCEIALIVEKIGLKVCDLFARASSLQTNGHKRIVETYDYEDTFGVLQYQVVRYDPKDFKQRRPDGNDDWIWNLKGVYRVPYRLYELTRAPAQCVVYIVEGESDVDRLYSEGMIATCNPGGAGKWGKIDDSTLHGRHVVILPDNDKPGRKHAEDVVTRLHGKAASVSIVELPGLADHGDVSDWLDAGNDTEDLDALAAQAPEWAGNIGTNTITSPEDNTPHQSVASRGIVNKPSPKPKLWRPFPTHLLPSPIRHFISEGAKSAGVDEAMYIVPVLATCASAIGATRLLKVKNDWLAPSILWGVTIARSGSVKSPPFTNATKPLALRDAGKLRDHEDKLLSYERDLAIYDEKYKAWKKNAATSSEDPPVKPKEPEPERLLVNDPTVEALELLLSKHPRGLLLARDELSGWLKSFGAYKHGRGGDEASWIAMYNGLRLVVDRKTNERLIVCERASVSICGTIQPAIIRSSLREDHFHSGLAARILMISPPRQERRWNDYELSRDTELIYDHTIGKLLTLAHDVTDGGWEKPRTIKFSPEAKQLYKEFFNRHGAVQDQTEDGRLCAALSKLEETACRLALIIHFIRWADDDPYITDADCIGVEDIESAIKIADWFIHETERVYALFSEDEGAIQARELYDWVMQQGGVVAVRDLQMRSRNYKNSQEAEAALHDLTERGLGAWDFPKPGPTGGAPSKRFIAATDSHVNNTPSNSSATGGSVDIITTENERVA